MALPAMGAGDSRGLEGKPRLRRVQGSMEDHSGGLGVSPAHIQILHPAQEGGYFCICEKQ